MVAELRNGRHTGLGGDRTNGAVVTIEASAPYTVGVTIKGTADLLMHRWNCEAVTAKASAAKGSKAKKTDDIESYVWRNDDGLICLPGEYLRQSVIHAAKYKQDPRSPRKSAMDLFKAGIVCTTQLADLGKEKWDYEHQCRVTIQRNGVNRVRPAMKAGWVAQLDFEILLPEYINPDLFQETLTAAGRLVGVGDFRPTYGRFAVTAFEVLRQD